MRSYSRSSRANERRGAVAVEMAIVTPVFVALALGLCEFGQALRVKTALSKAARCACGTASRPGRGNADAVHEALASLAADRIPTDSVNVEVLVNGDHGNAAGADRNDEVTVVVSIDAEKASLFQVLNFLRSRSVLSDFSTMLKQG